jgi:hypothetical protein
MSALVQYEPFVDNTTKLFLEQTKNIFVDNPEGCDFTQWLQFYAFDVIGEITYSKRHGFIEKNEDVDGIVGYLTWLFLYVAPVCFPARVPILINFINKLLLFLDWTNPLLGYAPAQEPNLPQTLSMGLHRCHLPRCPLRQQSHG